MFLPDRSKLIQSLKSFSNTRILIVGDLILDTYLEGRIGRISPEAPVPLVEVESEYSNPGGAANVAHNIHCLGGAPVLVGTIGADRSGEEFIDLVRKLGMNDQGIFVDNGKRTTVKTRILGQHRQVLRVDSEQTDDISSSTENSLLDTVRHCIPEVDAVILEDYNKGLLTPRLIHEIIALAREKQKVITVDPKFLNFFEYREITLFKPNQHEIERIYGIHPGRRSARLGDIGDELRKKLDAEAVLITCGEKGMLLIEKDGETNQLASIAQEVYDVSGAGDSVIAVCTVALSAGASLKEAVFLANIAGGIEVGKKGVATVTREEIETALENDTSPYFPFTAFTDGKTH
jgi:rfaE bifunctional protein kinase chain/domain